jgi:predicted RNA-binding protein YlxR (DUF448 family)
VNISYGAVRELLSQMVRDGQVKNQGRGQYVLPDRLQKSPDNAASLTNGKGDVSLSGLSGDLRKQGEGSVVQGEESVVTCTHGYASGNGCYLCDPEHPFRKEQRGSK